MSKFSPKFLVSLFAVAITMRTGYVFYEYYSDIFTANAAEKTEQTEQVEKKPKPSSEAKNSVDALETVSDKMLKEKPKKLEKNHYAAQIATKSEIKNPEKVCITGPMLKDTLKQLDYLNQRQAEIMEQQRLLETSDRRVREQVAKLKIIKQEIVESAKLADTTLDKESKRIISIYEKMKPKEAANIFNEMTPDVAAELLRTMKEDQSSQILAKMNPKNAYDVTLSLAGGIKDTKEKYNSVKNN